MPFFLKHTKKQPPVSDRTNLSDVKYFVDAIKLMDEREIIGRFTQLFYHAKKTKLGYAFEPNINQEQVFDYMAQHMNRESIQLLLDTFDRVDELTAGKQNYSTTIKRELIGLVLGVKETHLSCQSTSNDIYHPR